MIIKHKNWISLIISLRGTALPAILPRMAVTSVGAVAVTYLQWRYTLFGKGLSALPFSLVGVALGIFLGFRNNTSYDRFWEGRKLWGRLVNASRSLTRQILTLVVVDEDAPHQVQQVHRELVYRLAGYVHAVRLHLRDDPDTKELEPFLPAEELAALADEYNRPIAILQKLGDRLQECWHAGHVHPYHLSLLENSLTELTTIQGACERIKSTPIPFSYTVLIHRIVAFYCLGLPFGICNEVGVMTPLVVAMVSYAFFGLDAIGDEIEQPFGQDPNDLPLYQLSRMIEVNLRQRLGEPKAELPPLARPDRHGYLD
jgi:putative membrane protein